jgi:hypothetical protein
VTLGSPVENRDVNRRRPHIGLIARGKRMKVALAGGAGLLVALTLIVGSLAGLDRQVFGNSDWQDFRTDAPDRAVVLAPDPLVPGPLGGHGGRRWRGGPRSDGDRAARP